jgi:hypothetical protein
LCRWGLVTGNDRIDAAHRNAIDAISEGEPEDGRPILSDRDRTNPPLAELIARLQG